MSVHVVIVSKEPKSKCSVTVQTFLPKADLLNLLRQWFPTSGRDSNQGRGGSDVGSREVFMENSIIIKK
jgi:hypothetical protein